MSVKIGNVSDADILSLVAVHNHAFPDFFLTGLGNRFLSLYYRTVRENESGILLGYYDEGRLMGFCAATMRSASFHSQLIKKPTCIYDVAFVCAYPVPEQSIRLYRILRQVCFCQ